MTDQPQEPRSAIVRTYLDADGVTLLNRTNANSSVQEVHEDIEQLAFLGMLDRIVIHRKDGATIEYKTQAS